LINSDIKSNAQPWELEVVCKNKKYLDEVVTAILKHGSINFEVTVEEFNRYHNEEIEGIYTVLLWSTWFNNLANISNDLRDIESKLDKL
jgi:hypothetical protein